jgi:hypothetical protein
MRMRDRIARELLDGEKCEWSHGALRTIGPVTQAGKLCLTDQRLLFVPNGYGNLKKRPGWSIGRSNVSDVSIAARTGQPYNGGMRRRLRVRSTDGSEELFVMNKVGAVSEDLRTFLARSPG